MKHGIALASEKSNTGETPESDYPEWVCGAYADDAVGGCHAGRRDRSGHGKEGERGLRGVE